MEGTFDDYLSELAKKGAWMGAMEVGGIGQGHWTPNRDLQNWCPAVCLRPRKQETTHQAVVSQKNTTN